MVLLAFVLGVFLSVSFQMVVSSDFVQISLSPRRGF